MEVPLELFGIDHGIEEIEDQQHDDRRENVNGVHPDLLLNEVTVKKRRAD